MANNLKNFLVATSAVLATSAAVAQQQTPKSETSTPSDTTELTLVEKLMLENPGSDVFSTQIEQKTAEFKQDGTLMGSAPLSGGCYQLSDADLKTMAQMDSVRRANALKPKN